MIPIAQEPVPAQQAEPKKASGDEVLNGSSVENKKESKGTYKITPLEKKSIIQTTTYKTGDPAHLREGDKMATREVTFRWGYAVVEADGDDLPKDGDIDVTDYSIVENAYEEEVAVVWEFSGNVSDEERETIESESSENFGDDWLEEIGRHNFDHEDKILEPYKIEKQ